VPLENEGFQETRRGSLQEINEAFALRQNQGSLCLRDYDGTVDFDKFERWSYEVDTWIDFNSIPTRWAVRLTAASVSGPASEYFMDFVATDHAYGSYKMKQIYSGLFE
jgi:hypothetical protein